MQIIYWSVISLLFVVSFIGLIYPIIPSVLFIVAGFLLYGWFFEFTELTWLFWMIQGFFIALLFGADYLANLLGVKKFGGSKAAIWGSTVGLLVGPFIVPFIGVIIGPFIGAVFAELLFHKKEFKLAIKSGVGSLLGFISGVFAKGFIQLMMIAYFLFQVLR
ncbi:DUF456 domain-containing protein [Metabacillus litoralis]|uniref:DUF456 domain-containing protein n=1 Tax=Metabacillus TaxID=2675233 RepID=UPI001B9D878B|nr:DUF456 domain-containing protein [Metabacillus litoralis]MCM3161793.1 DUF456 domain-containing protein [Metabacillus litoralis]MCM3412614.1 DUF456 domain-containing protein [Metabacillus litoralis]